MDKENWVDFRAIKESASMQMVLDRYGIDWLKKQKDELRGRCPIHKGEGDRTFHVNLSKKAFNCFSCKARGNVLDLVAAMEGCNTREAALKLKEWLGAPDSPPALGSTSAKREAQPVQINPEAINPPLGFQLRIDPSHEYGTIRGLSQETIETFGGGLCVSKGTFSGRYVIPLHNTGGELIGYAGRSLDDSEPKYLVPTNDKGFYKSHVLFNLHRVLKDRPVPWVVVVEGYFGTMKVAQAGFPVVAILGASLSEVQAELLQTHFKRALLIFDGDEAGRSVTDDCLVRLGRKMWVRAALVSDNEQPDQLSSEAITELVSSL